MGSKPVCARTPGGRLATAVWRETQVGINLLEVDIMRKLHWQDIVSVWLGVWLVFSPFVLDFSGPAGVFSVGLGVAIILIGVEALFIPSYLEEWCEIVMALGLFLAPVATGYHGTLAAANGYVVGALVIVFAVWEMATDREFLVWWQEHVQHPTQ